MRTSLSIGLHLVALGIIGVLAIGHIEGINMGVLSIVIATTALGYLIGSWTCHIHKKNRGLWITIIIFSLLNFLHSLIDGASLVEIGGGISKDLAVFSHELARQPALYITLWGMLTPFGMRTLRVLIVPLVVTGTWAIATYLGFHFVQHLASLSWIEKVADYALFLFLGDIIHHLLEDIRKKRHTCCHH